MSRPDNLAKLSPEQRRNTATLGGRAAHASGHGHRFSLDELRRGGAAHRAPRRHRLPVRLVLVAGRRFWSLQLYRGVKRLVTLGRRRIAAGRKPALWTFIDGLHVGSLMVAIPLVARRQELDLGGAR